jgi:HSP20 family protein
MFPILHRRGRTAWEDPLELMRREFGRMLSSWAEPGATEATLTAEYPMDVWEDKEHVYVEAEMPGFKRDQIDVTLEQGALNVTAERQPEEVKAKQRLRERRYTRVQRSVTLPPGIDESDVDARFEDGVLHLKLKKSPEAARRRIEVR